MDKFWNQSLTRRLLKLLVLGFIINAAVYVTVLHFGKLLLEDFFGGSSFIYDSQQKDIDALQAFVAENGVSADDYELLRDWTYHEKIDRLTVSRDRILLCDTGYTGFSFDNHRETEYLNRNWMYFHDVVFSDGSADVFIYNDYADSIYYLFYTGALGFCFFLFMVIFSIGLRKELKYINVLNQNVRMIESGEWRQAVPVRGQDELGSLASGLDHMRQSLIENKEREKEMKKAQDKLVVGMAHDLRNPMTGLMTYLELAKKNPSAEEAGSYIEKAVSKTFEIRDLSDHLFDYFRIHSVNGKDSSAWSKTKKFSYIRPYITATEKICNVGDKFYVKLKGVATVSYSIKDEKIATVNEKGKIKIHKAGTTKLTILGENGKKYTCVIVAGKED